MLFKIFSNNNSSLFNFSKDKLGEKEHPHVWSHTKFEYADSL